MLLRVIDFETTGIKSHNHKAGVVEYALVDVATDGEVERQFSRLVNCPIPVDVEARAVHHITDDEIASGTSFDTACHDLMRDRPDYFVAHNVDFDRAFFEGGGIPWICTLKCARKHWPEAPRHSNQVLRYWLELSVPDIAGMQTHRALADALVTAQILRRLLSDGISIDQMVAWTAGAPDESRINFGKHKGKLWAELDRDYLHWVANKSDLGAGVKKLAQKHLKGGK